MKWRPKDWKTFWKRNPIYNETYSTCNMAREFENGADALLEEIIKLVGVVKSNNPASSRDYKLGFDTACDRILGNLEIRGIKEAK